MALRFVFLLYGGLGGAIQLRKICEVGLCHVSVGTTIEGFDLMQSYEKRVLRVLSYIHDNPGGDLSLDTLADVAAMSRFHWHRGVLGDDG